MAVFDQRPILEVLKNNHIDYVFQVNDNQPEVLDAVQESFREKFHLLFARFSLPFPKLSTVFSKENEVNEKNVAKYDFDKPCAVMSARTTA